MKTLLIFFFKLKKKIKTFKLKKNLELILKIWNLIKKNKYLLIIQRKQDSNP